MAAEAAPGGEFVHETERLILRPWRAVDAGVQREFWTERDPRVPPHRRIDANGNPTVDSLAEAIRAQPQPSILGLLAVERKLLGDVIGYCGLIGSDAGGLAPPMPRRVSRETSEHPARPTVNPR